MADAIRRIIGTSGRARGALGCEGLGRSRGGLYTKLHLVCEGLRNPLAALLTPGQLRRGSTDPATSPSLRSHRPPSGRTNLPGRTGFSKELKVCASEPSSVVLPPVTHVIAGGVVVSAVYGAHPGTVEVHADCRLLARVPDAVDAPVAGQYGRGTVAFVPRSIPGLLQACVVSQGP